MGQSIDISHLGKYLRRSYDKHYSNALSDLGLTEQMVMWNEGLSEREENLVDRVARANTQRELEAGIQTIQYQINTLMTTNGQAPFVTLFMHVVDGDEYEVESARIVEEVLKQRIQGIKNEVGVYVTPAFPKLIYVLDDNNIGEDSKYYNLTSLAIRCTAKRMYPDYISAKKMRENYEGNVFAPIDQLVA